MAANENVRYGRNRYIRTARFLVFSVWQQNPRRIARTTRYRNGHDHHHRNHRIKWHLQNRHGDRLAISLVQVRLFRIQPARYSSSFCDWLCARLWPVYPGAGFRVAVSRRFFGKRISLIGYQCLKIRAISSRTSRNSIAHGPDRKICFFLESYTHVAIVSV